MSARKRHHGYRHIRTTQERRIGCDEEHYKYSRPNRHTNRLPEAYDDIVIHNDDKSWKSERQSQFRNEKYKRFTISFYPETFTETRQMRRNVYAILEKLKYRIVSDSVKMYNTSEFGGKIVYYGKDIGKIKGCVIK